MLAPGVVVIWSGGRPRITTQRMVGSLEIGHALAPDDVELLDNHAAVAIVGGNFEIGARTGSIEVNGRPVTAKTFDGSSPPLFVAAGGSVIAVVSDVSPYEGLSLEGGSTLGHVVRLIDEAANAEEHLSLRGPDHVTRRLALRYADKLGSHAWFRPGGDQHLDHFLSTRRSVRTVILELSRPLFDHDVRAIANLLETDLRFVVVRRDDHFISWLPPQLVANTLGVSPNFDERVLTIAQRAGEDRRLGARLVAALLHRSQHVPDAQWDRLLDLAIEASDADPAPDIDLILRHLPS